MLVNIELLRALRAAGADDERAGAAAAILADQERRLNRLEFIARVAARGLAVGLGLAVCLGLVFFLLLVTLVGRH